MNRQTIFTPPPTRFDVILRLDCINFNGLLYVAKCKCNSSADLLTNRAFIRAFFLAIWSRLDKLTLDRIFFALQLSSIGSFYLWSSRVWRLRNKSSNFVERFDIEQSEKVQTASSEKMRQTPLQQSCEKHIKQASDKRRRWDGRNEKNDPWI